MPGGVFWVSKNVSFRCQGVFHGCQGVMVGCQGVFHGNVLLVPSISCAFLGFSADKKCLLVARKCFLSVRERLLSDSGDFLRARERFLGAREEEVLDLKTAEYEWKFYSRLYLWVTDGGGGGGEASKNI